MRKGIKKVIAALAATTMMAAGLSAFASELDDKTELMASGAGLVYTGAEQTPKVQLFDGEVLLEEGVDYDLSYENNINVGTATIVVTFKGNYDGVKRVPFNILAQELSNSDISFTGVEDSYVFEDKAIEPTPEIRYGDRLLEADKDYTLSYENNISVGTANINITFIGNYSGTSSINFEITAKDVTNDENLISSSIPAQTYTGTPLEPKPEVKYGDKVLEEGKDYTLEYENNTDVGEATVKVIFTGDYTGEKDYTFEIQKKEITEDNTEITQIEDAAYTGSEIRPEMTIKVDGLTLEANKDFTVTYENNLNVGTATVNIEFIGNYSGEMNREFHIMPFVVTDDNIRISNIEDQRYTGEAIMPDITISIIR